MRRSSIRDLQPQIVGVNSRSQAQIVFHALAVAVRDDVHTWQHVLRFRRREMWDVGAPLRWIAAQEIIAFAVQSRHTAPREICFTAGKAGRGSFQTARGFRLPREALLWRK